ncbi:hypothetical protein C4D60_Mb07t23230 [Musa balbisiana]|uniref:Uncharacterized protein n=1 Tax=Musa balbisiana TaxID=52838 RepID=A0A4S8JHE3_MUSBA|nr:hypothetical protein C4D60_Mb07t23230 [Musa balbisiana]
MVQSNSVPIDRVQEEEVFQTTNNTPTDRSVASLRYLQAFQYKQQKKSECIHPINSGILQGANDSNNA